jgi:prepilin-type N-terminal cleavage/methylation domain-containing protein
MILKRLLGKIQRQAGFSLLELLVVLAILSLLSMAINAGIVHAVRVSSDGSERMTAIKQVENAMQWLTKDVQQAQTVNISLGNGFPLGLSWIEWNGTVHHVSYRFAGTDLERVHEIDSGISQTTVVARYLDVTGDRTTCRFTDKGSFYLPDIGDSFTITGGEQSDEGLVVTGSGSVSVAVTGNATYESGMWTAPLEGDTVVVTAGSSGTRGLWTSTDMNISVSAVSDSDGDMVISGNAILVKLTANGGTDSERSETRISLIVPRSRL